MSNFQEIQKRIMFIRECLEEAKEDFQNWKPVWEDYEDQIRTIIDNTNRVNVFGYSVTDILIALDRDQYEKLCSETFQLHYDMLTCVDSQNKASEIHSYELDLEHEEQELVYLIDSQAESVD